MRHAFSLVEMSLVLVIIGLLVGGVLTGRSLIRAADLKAVIGEYEQYKAAVNTFNDKYLALPGDYSLATNQWGTMATGTCPNATAGTGTQTCNGNGDGRVLESGAASQSNERFLFWQHLSNAGLIQGAFTGIAGSTNNTHHLVKVNSPASELNETGWSAEYTNDFNNDTQRFNGIYNLMLLFGASTHATYYDPVMKPEEMWSMDSKMDDGLPAAGKLVVRNRVSCALAANNAALTTSTADAAKLDAIYNLNDTSLRCAGIFRNVVNE